MIDGAHLEGGGQIVRASVALSALTGTHVKIRHIRSGREKPGLKPQHITAVRAVAAACDAEVTGCAAGSTDLGFLPGPLSRKEIALDVGTAGSIPLVLQAWLPLALRAGGTITLTGGTEVERSPTIDYLDHILFPLLGLHGADISLEVLSRGYYPRGGGMVRVEAEPSPLKPIYPDRCRSRAGVCSCSAGLPRNIVGRQAKSVVGFLSRHTPAAFPVHTDPRPGPGTGSSCTVWMGWMGGIGIGRPGYPAEKVGEDAARALVVEMEGGGSVDVHLADQLLMYLALAGGAYTARTLTSHARTMCWLLDQFGYHIRVWEEGVTGFAFPTGA